MTRRLLLALCSAAACMLLLELGFRAAGYGAPKPATDVVFRWVPDEPYLRRQRYSHHHKPSWTGAMRYEAAHDETLIREVPVETDAWGLRRTGITPTAGDRVLLVLGDSITFGQGVLGQETFVADLDRRLDGWTVKNGGVSAWSLHQEVVWYAEVGVDLGADAVLVATYPNDHQGSPMGMGGGPPLIQTVDGLPPPPDTGLYLWNVALRGRQARELATAFHGQGATEHAAVTRSLVQYAHGYAYLARIEPSAGVLLLPAMKGDGEPLRQAMAQVGEQATRAGLDVFDATGSLDAVHPADARVHPADPHPSAQAHAAIANAIEPELRTWLKGMVGDAPAQ